MKVNILSNKIGWFGKYSGYECLPEYFNKDIDAQVNISKYNLYNKLVGKYYKVQNKWNLRSEDILNEMRFYKQIGKSDISHILYLETHLHLLDNIKNLQNLYGTIHLPISQWKEKKLSVLSRLENVILLYDEELSTFSKFIDESKIHVIKHGVDVDFFKPGEKSGIKKNKILFVGHFLRNFDMMLKVFKLLIKDVDRNIELHFIIPEMFRNIAGLKELSENSNVFFHQKLSDEELLQQYQTSNLLVMPMQDSGANTAIIQALATGLPIVSTNVGGIKSYGGDSVFPIIENDDVPGMVGLIFNYLNNDDLRHSISEKQRKFTVDNLDWRIISEQHVNLYKQSILQLA